MKRKPKEAGLSSEYHYASHHHLIPLYVLSGLAILAILVIGCFVVILWQNTMRDSFRPAATATISAVENLYLPTVIVPVEKKQYVYSANIRFAAPDPYDGLRYAYDPGTTNTRTSSTITLTTTGTLKNLEAPLLNNPVRAAEYTPRLQQCGRLYVIRFEPGLTPYGGFGPLQDVKLRDGRTAYIHKNTGCVPSTPQAMTTLDDIEKTILSVESY